MTLAERQAEMRRAQFLLTGKRKNWHKRKNGVDRFVQLPIGDGTLESLPMSTKETARVNKMLDLAARVPVKVHPISVMQSSMRMFDELD